MWVALGWVVFTLFIAFVYQQSRFGLALRASREDEFAARAAGINIYYQRLIAFVLSAFFVGLGGVLHAHFLGVIAARNYWLGITFISLAMLIIGGQRSLTGAVVGVVVISTVVELLLKIEDGFSVGALEISAPPGIQELGIAIVMLIILIFRPDGIMAGRELPSPFGRRRDPSPVKKP
jgi:branched-chain amino acid transport system permease protein